MNEKNTFLRDELAIGRTRLANERTLLAYARTAIMLAASGVTVLQVFRSSILSMAAGCLLMGASVIAAAWGYRRYRATSTMIEATRRREQELVHGKEA